MEFARAEAGLSGSFDTRPVPIDLERFGIQGSGCLRIDGSCQPPRMTWNDSRHAGFTFESKNKENFDETRRALEAFHAEATALRGPTTPTVEAANLEQPYIQPDSRSKDEAHERSTKHDAYMSRIQLLKDEAVHDGYVLNLASEFDFRHFLRATPDIRSGNLVLMDNGNLRAIWKDNDGARLALQFLGGRMVQYVIFKRRKMEQHISRVAGRDSIDGFERQIHAFELHSLLFE